MLKLVDLTFYANLECRGLREVIALQANSLGYIPYLHPDIHVEVIKHLGHEEYLLKDGIRYSAFQGRNGFASIPWKTLRYIRSLKPDVILIQGLGFPLQLTALRIICGKHCTIIAQHHAERSYKGIRKQVQRMADHFTDAYLFTSVGNAEPWVQDGIIGSIAKCHALPEASTYMQPLDRMQSREKLGMRGDHNFIWVGRLIPRKDPLTVLRAFEEYLRVKPEARLYMLFQTDDLLPLVQENLARSEQLRQAVILQGPVPYTAMATWYSAADFFIFSSLYEGSGYALIECMACGSIPIVTDIPPFRMLTGNGERALLYAPGDRTALYRQLVRLDTMDREQMRSSIRKHFEQNLSFRAIGESLSALLTALRK